MSLIELKQVFLTNGDVEVLDKSLNLLYDYEVEQDCHEARNTVASLSRLISDIKEEFKK